MKKVMNAMVTVATIAVMIPFVIASAVPGEAKNRRGAARLDRVPDALGHVVLRLEEPEPALACSSRRRRSRAAP